MKGPGESNCSLPPVPLDFIVLIYSFDSFGYLQNPVSNCLDGEAKKRFFFKKKKNNLIVTIISRQKLGLLSTIWYVHGPVSNFPSVST